MAIKDRLDRLGSRVQRCPVCGYPGPPPKDMGVEIVVREIGIDGDGNPITPPPLPPRYCSGCGRQIEPIKVKGLDERANR